MIGNGVATGFAVLLLSSASVVEVVTVACLVLACQFLQQMVFSFDIDHFLFGQFSFPIISLKTHIPRNHCTVSNADFRIDQEIVEEIGHLWKTIDDLKYQQANFERKTGRNQ